MFDSVGLRVVFGSFVCCLGGSVCNVWCLCSFRKYLWMNGWLMFVVFLMGVVISILWLVSIVMCVDSVIIVLRLCVIIMMVSLSVWCSVVISLMNLLDVCGLRLVVGLLRNSSLGFSVIVCVMLICLIILFDSVVGIFDVCLYGSLIILSFSIMMLCSRFGGMWLSLCSGCVMLLNIVIDENSVFCWNSIFECVCIICVLVLLIVVVFLLNILIVFDVGCFRLRIWCMSVVLLEFELLMIDMILLCCMLKLSFW